MRRTLPIAVVAGVGFFMLIQYFIPREEFETLYEWALDWTMVIGAFAMALGLVGLFLMIFVGLVPHYQESLRYGTLFMDIFEYIYIPIQAAMFSLLAFYIASAAYRAFRARTVLATILLVSAIIIMLRLVPLGPLSAVNQWLVNFILTVPNMAAKRAFWLGVGLGATATALKIMLGIERGYMGRD